MRVHTSAQATAPEHMDPMPEALIDATEALEARFGGRLAVAASSLRTGETLERRSDEPLPSASLIKVPIMAACEAAYAKGELGPREALGPDGEPVEELVEKMIRFSDNDATNLLIDRLGMAPVNALCEDLGMKATRLRRRMLDWDARQRGEENTTSARDMLRIMTSIAVRELVSSEASERMWRILRTQDHREMIPSGLPRDCDVGNKTGGLDDVDHDAAIARTPVGELVLVLMFAEISAGEETRRALRDLAAAVYEHFASPVVRVVSDPPGLPLTLSGRQIGTTPCVLPGDPGVGYPGISALAVVVGDETLPVEPPPMEPGCRTTLRILVDRLREG